MTQHRSTRTHKPRSAKGPLPYASLCTALLLAAALSSVTGCHKNTAPVPPPQSLGPTPEAPAAPTAPTASLVADPLAVDLGQSVVLNWRSSNATAVTIDGIGPVAPNGTQTVSPSTSTNFHLTAKGDGGSTEANVRVTVRVPTKPDAPKEVADAGADMGSEAVFEENVKDVFFDYDSAELRPDAQVAAVKAAGYLVAHPDIRLVIGGYCDDRGSAEYNLALGEHRADAAKTALVSAGVAAARIRIISYGKEKQFCTDETEACWQQNRRAQFSLDR
jgi:peptidoglycan-associated lipoprotein